MYDIVTAARILGCGTRVRLLQALGEEGLHLSAAAAETGIAPSTASHHMAQLVRAGLVQKQYRGRRCVYRWGRLRWTLVATRAPAEPR
jgi:DNA-binding transcriptional ArsR family regulator